MQRLQLFIQTDAAKDTIDELGKIGAIQFIDVCSFHLLSPIISVIFS